MSKIDEPDPSIHRKMTAQAILADLLALPVAQDEVSQKLTQSNQEWAKYAHIRNAIRQEWRKALTAYFEGVEKLRNSFFHALLEIAIPGRKDKRFGRCGQPAP